MDKKACCYLCGLIILFLFLLSLNIPLVFGQERLKEDVTVIAVEVPVRVLSKGKSVRNLSKEDFEIYENGLRQKITAFEVVSRKISLTNEIPSEDLETPPRKRLFVVIFNIFDYSESVGEGIDYFFENVFRPGDKIIIITEDMLFNINIEKSPSDIILDLKETLKRYKRISSIEIRKSYHKLWIEAGKLLFILRSSSREDRYPYILNFYDGYLRIWEDYKRRYIYPDIDLYKSIIRRIKQIEGEKWALCFLQRELFPKLAGDGPLSTEIRNITEGRGGLYARLIQNKQRDLQRSFDYPATFPTELLKNIFMEANITFHLILLKSLKVIADENFELREVAQDYEDCFKQISSSTGGYTTFSNKISEAIKEASEIEDFHYLLVYTPDNLETEKREIEVKVKRRGVKIIHLKQFLKKEAPPVTISGFKAGGKRISFLLDNYKMINMKGKITGIVDIKVTLFDENSERVFDEKKTLNLFEKDTNISLNFKELKSGRHFIIVQAVDKISNEIDVYSGHIEL